MRFVATAMRERVTHMSWPKAGTSGHQTARKPRSSAKSAYSTVRGPGGRRKSKVSTRRSMEEGFNERITMCRIVEMLRVDHTQCIVVCQATIPALEQWSEPLSLLM